MNKAEYTGLVGELASHTEAAEAIKASGKGSSERKAAKVATNLVDLLAGLDVEEALQSDLERVAADLSAKVAETFDSTDGQVFADALTALVKVPILRPDAFDEVEVTDLLNRWKAATGRKPRGEGNGDGSQDVPCPIRVTFDYPVEVDLADTITHDSTWSSVSNEISKRARAIDGIQAGTGYKRPEAAKVQWREATKAIKDGEAGPFTIEVETGHGVMVATVEAIR